MDLVVPCTIMSVPICGLIYLCYQRYKILFPDGIRYKPTCHCHSHARKS